jgi:hypothetical protein
MLELFVINRAHFRRTFQRAPPPPSSSVRSSGAVAPGSSLRSISDPARAICTGGARSWSQGNRHLKSIPRRKRGCVLKKVLVG